VDEAGWEDRALRVFGSLSLSGADGCGEGEEMMAREIAEKFVDDPFQQNELERHILRKIEGVVMEMRIDAPQIVANNCVSHIVEQAERLGEDYDPGACRWYRLF
jgi:hypothetical protein